MNNIKNLKDQLAFISSNQEEIKNRLNTEYGKAFYKAFFKHIIPDLSLEQMNNMTLLEMGQELQRVLIVLRRLMTKGCQEELKKATLIVVPFLTPHKDNPEQLIAWMEEGVITQEWVINIFENRLFRNTVFLNIDKWVLDDIALIIRYLLKQCSIAKSMGDMDKLMDEFGKLMESGKEPTPDDILKLVLLCYCKL